MKRPLLHRLFSAWLALLVFTASVGLAVQQHTCRISGQQSAAIIFSPQEHGCPPVGPTTQQHATPGGKVQLTGACCEFGAHLHKVEVPSGELTWVKAPAPDWVPVWLDNSGWPTVSAATVRHTAASRWHAADSSPPPRAGRTLLTFVGVLIV